MGSYVTSTHGSSVPVEVANDPTIFNGIKKIFLGFDADEPGDNIAEVWTPFVGIRGFRVKPFLINAENKSQPKDWTDFFNSGKTMDDFARLLSNAEQIKTITIDQTPSNLNDYKPNQTYAFNPIDISGAYVNKHLYYTVIAHETGIDPESYSIAHARVIKVIRSDGEVLDYRSLKQLVRPGALQTPIYALSDGTVIADIPTVAPKSSWHWDHIQAWLKGKIKTRYLSEIVKDIIAYLKGQIWLPHEDDYVLLALTAVVSYVQAVFQAVGYILMTGEAGTGKSEVGSIMARVSMNGDVIGKSSAATITRKLNDTRGFLAIDDIESISNALKNSGDDDLLQILKVAYKKSTASRTVTDTKDMTIKTLNFYGVKLLTNTSGMEDILKSRTFVIPTQKARNGFIQADIDDEVLTFLRHELHAWSMDNVKLVEEAYTKYPTTDRALEISAPLKTIADLCEAPEYHDALDRILKRRETEERCKDSPQALVKEAVLSLVSQGYTSLFVEHVIMEISTLVPADFAKEYTTDIPWWRKIDEIRHMMSSMGYIPTSTEVRKRPYGKMGLWREYPIQTGIVLHDLEEKNPNAIDGIKVAYEGNQFCKKHSNCEYCPYSIVQCEIRNKTNKPRI